MKQASIPSNWLLAALAGLALAFATSSALAAENIQIQPSGIQTNGDPTATDIANWGTFWITEYTNLYYATCTNSFDPTMQSDPSIPGSIYCVCDWQGTFGDDINFGATLPNGNSTWLGNPAITNIDGTQYAYLLMDVYWTNVTNITSYGGIGLMTPGYGMVFLTNNVAIPSKPGWQHYAIAIDPTLANLSSIAGVMIYDWQDAGPPAHAEFWVDNVQLIARAVPVPPPTLSLDNKPVPGLAFIAASPGTYDRQEIRTVGTNYSWVGASGPVSYSFNVAKLADNAHAGFEIFIYLNPGMPSPTDGGADYGETNVVRVGLGNDADGSGWCDLNFKTNAPNSNGVMWGLGYLGGVWNATVDGTWTLTFNQDTNVTLTAPGGGTLVTNLPPEVVALFNKTPGMQISIGGVPGDPSRVGQMAVVTEIKITGTPGEPNVDSNFLTQPLDTNVWEIIAASPAGVQQIPTNAAYWVNWTLPYTGFTLQTKAALGSGAWTDSTITGYDGAGFHHDLFTISDLPGSNSGYFRLIKRVGTQLQVLLPGETNAPGTTTGKIGTPQTQTVGNLFNIIINMCDPSWNIVSSSDTVAITSTDTTAFTPPNTALVNGTVTITDNFFFGQTGTWTITATDVTNPAILPGTSTPITISQ